LVEFSRWVAVVAKVPIKNQTRLYRDAFENTRGGFSPDKDYPVYRGYFVQRAEVVPGQETYQWQDLAVYDAKGTPIRQQIAKVMSNAANGALDRLMELASTEWAKGGLGEVVDPRYLSPDGLVYPLPPLVGRLWGKDATHPDIPLISDATFGAMVDAGAVSQPAAAAAQSVDETGFGSAGSSSRGRGNFQDIGRGGRGWSDGDDGRGRSGRGYDPTDTDRGGGRGASQIAAVNVSDYLLRFFDFNVEPGKRYVYRVRLVVTDPNLYLLANPNLLAPEVVDRLRKKPKHPQTGQLLDFIDTPWSEPSPPVEVPLEGRVRLANVVLGDEPKVNLLVDGFGKSPESNNWIRASAFKEFPRGGTINFIDDAEYITEEQTHIDRVKSFKFTTGVTVLDVRGGERLAGRGDLPVPARVLVLGPTGELSIRQETDDASHVQAHKELFAKPRPGDDNRQPDAGRRNR
jgi:hypothetical protein